MEMTLDNVVAAAALATVIINVIGTMALLVIESVQDILRAKRRRDSLK